MSTSRYHLLRYWVPDSKFIDLGHIKERASIEEHVELTESRNVTERLSGVSNELDGVATVHGPRRLELCLRTSSTANVNFLPVGHHKAFPRREAPGESYFVFFATACSAREAFSNSFSIGKAKAKSDASLGLRNMLARSSKATVYLVDWVDSHVVLGSGHGVWLLLLRVVTQESRKRVVIFHL
jgi:hypothetical protein